LWKINCGFEKVFGFLVFIWIIFSRHFSIIFATFPRNFQENFWIFKWKKSKLFFSSHYQPENNFFNFRWGWKINCNQLFIMIEKIIDFLLKRMGAFSPRLISLLIIQLYKLLFIFALHSGARNLRKLRKKIKNQRKSLIIYLLKNIKFYF
jgi:hypothetical protein